MNEGVNVNVFFSKNKTFFDLKKLEGLLVDLPG